MNILKRRWKYHFGKRYRSYLFHRVQPEDDLSEIGLSLTPASFEKELTQLQKNSNFIFADDFGERVSQGLGSGNDVAITFDDGYADNYLYAFEVIQKLQIPMTIFVATDFMDSSHLMWWDRLVHLQKNAGIASAQHSIREQLESLKSLFPDQIEAILNSQFGEAATELPQSFCEKNRGMTWKEAEEMQKSGLVRFMPHTCTHTSPGVMDNDTFISELQNSRKIIEEKLQVSCKTFAYPYGRPWDRKDAFDAILKEQGFTSAFLAWGKENIVGDDSYRLDRKTVQQK